MINDSKTIIDFLNDTFKYGSEIQNQLMQSNEQKKVYLEETTNKLDYLMDKHQILKLKRDEVTTEIGDLKIKIKDEQDKFKQKLVELSNCSNLLNTSKDVANKLSMIKGLQSQFLKSITNAMIILRNYQVRSCRDDLKSCEFLNVDKMDDYDKVLDEVENEFDDLNLQLDSLIAKLNDDEKRISFQVFDKHENEQNDQFLSAMESCAFDYDQFNY